MVQERSRCDFDQKQMYRYLYSNLEERAYMEKSINDLTNDPVLQNSHKYYEWDIEKK